MTATTKEAAAIPQATHASIEEERRSAIGLFFGMHSRAHERN
jgi:hypothetical protein